MSEHPPELVEKVAQTIYRHFVAQGIIDRVSLDVVGAARAALDAITETHAVVELPKPERETSHGQVWTPRFFSVWSHAGPDDYGVRVGGIGPRSATDARELAGAILAAARATEQHSCGTEAPDQ